VFRTSSRVRSIAALATGTAAVTLGLLGAPTAAGAGPSSLSSVVLADTLPGLVATAPGPTNGPINGSNLGSFGTNGAGASGLARQLADGEVSGELRFWLHRPPNGDGVVISAFQYRDPTRLGSFLAGMNSSFAGVAVGTFAVPGIYGASGYTAHVSASGTPATAYIVTLAKGRIAFEVQVITAAGDLTKADAVSVAARQAANAPGALRAPTPPPSSTSRAYRVGEVVGLVLLGVIAVALVLFAVRRSRVRRSRVRGSRVSRSRLRGSRVSRSRVSRRPAEGAPWPAVPSLPDPPPTSPVPSREVGWHVDPDHLSEQAYWDGGSWTTRRRWSGATWVEDTDEPRREGGPPG
jgi:hypothetical protein